MKLSESDKLAVYFDEVVSIINILFIQKVVTGVNFPVNFIHPFRDKSNLNRMKLSTRKKVGETLHCLWRGRK